MNKDALVSVVIPTYNSEEYISGCLDATIRQTYSNIEILLVDNGSSDSTKSICREYAGKDSRIRTFSVVKTGASASRNCGIANSRGRYIVFFDSDDRPERDIIECYIKAMDEWRSKKVSLITSGMFYDNLFHKNVDDKISILEPSRGFIEGENYLLKRHYASTLAWLKIFNFVTNKFYDNEKIKTNNIKFDEEINIGEDLKFNLDYLDCGEGYIGMINKPLYHYIKRNEDSLSLTFHEGDIEDTKTIYRRFIDWESEQNGVTQDSILVIKSIYLTDWLSRMTTMHDHFEDTEGKKAAKIKIDSEISSEEFQSILKEVHKSGKISTIRYMALKTGRFDIFSLLRNIYQRTKG